MKYALKSADYISAPQKVLFKQIGGNFVPTINIDLN